MKSKLYIATDDKSPRRIKRTFGYIITGQTSDGKQHEVCGFGEADTFHEAGLQAMVEALDRFNRRSEIVIYLQDNWIGVMAKKNMETWQFNNWENRRGHKVEHWQYWQRAYNSLRLHDVEFAALDPEQEERILAMISRRKEEAWKTQK